MKSPVVLFQGVSLTSTTLYLEIVPTRHRSKMSVFATIVWSASIVIYAVAAYLMKDLSWRYHQLVVGLTSTYYIVVPWWATLTLGCSWISIPSAFDDSAILFVTHGACFLTILYVKPLFRNNKYIKLRTECFLQGTRRELQVACSKQHVWCYRTQFEEGQSHEFQEC